MEGQEIGGRGCDTNTERRSETHREIKMVQEKRKMRRAISKCYRNYTRSQTHNKFPTVVARS